MKKIYSLFAIIIVLLFSTEDFFAQGNTCSTAEPFCTSVGTPYSYNNITGSPSATSMGCLSTTPNQSWFYIKTSGTGAMTYSLTQSSVAPGGTPNLDVDFIAYGPYTAAQFSVACSTLLTGSCTGDHNCIGNIEDCSYSSAATETMTLTSPGAGQYFLIMITNFDGAAGYITFSQTGGPASDCSITCPPSTFTLVATQDSNNANIPNGSTVNCSEPFWLDPPDLTPAGQPYNPFSDQLTPCLKVAINPITSQLQSDGSISVYENGTAYWTACPTVACPDNVGGNSTPGSQFNWFLGQVDPNFTHPAVFCRTTTAGTTPTVSLMSCWNNTLTLAGPQTWGTTTCFTLTAPTGTAAYGAASFSIAPATGSVGIVDLNWGKAYVDPSFLPSGTTYTVTYTFNNGVCGNVYGYYVFTVPSTPTITAISSQTVCSGSTVAATNFTVTPSAGASVSWVNNNTGIGVVASGTTNIASYTAPTVTATTVGNFTVASVSNGCIGNPRTFTITVNPKPTANAGSTNTLTCSNPTLSLSGSGGGTYSWTGSGIVSGSTTATPVINSPGTYSLVVTNSLSCASNVSTVSISQNTTTPSPSASNSSTLTCAISTVALTGGPASGVTYQWSGPGFSGGTTSQNAVANAPGTYTLNVTSSVNGCTNTAVTTVAQNTTAPSPSASNAATLTCTTNTVALTGGPASGVTYQWSGPGFSGGTTSQNAVATAAGTYTLKVTSSVNSCTAAATTVVSQNTTAPVPSASNSTTLTCSTNTVALTGGPASGVTYQWNGPGFSGGTTSQNAVATNAGTYTLTVTSTVNSCTAAATTVVSQNTTVPVPSASNSATLTCSTNTVALTGGPASGVTYQWSGPGFSGGTTSQNAVATAAGTYTLKVTSSVNSCTAAATTVVSQNTTAPVPSASNSASLTCSTNTVALTGGPASGVTYQWSGPGFSGGTTSQNAVATNAGTYTLTVTSTVNSCTAAATTVVSQNTTAPVPSASNSATLTCSTNTVSLTGGPASGVTYQWGGPGFSGGTTSQNAIANTPGTYTLTVTSTVNSCTAAATTAVNQNTTAPTVTMPSTQTITCSSPSVSLIASANPSTCTPVWTGGVCGGSTTYTASACSPNTYTLTVTNPLNGCTASGTVSAVASTGVPSVTASNSGSITCTNTSAQVTASTTMTPVTYAWTGPGSITGATSSTGTVSIGGSYQCIVTNTLTGCASTITTIVPTNTTPVTASVAPTSSITCTTTSLTLSASPTGAFSYSWSPAAGLSGNSVATPTVNQGGTYSVTITNTVNGCFASTNITVPSNTIIPTVTVSPNSFTTTCTTPTVQLTANTSTNSVTYSWTAPGSGTLTNSSINNPIASGSGVFSVIVTNTVNGCVSSSSSSSITINNTVPTASLSTNSLSITCSSPSPSVSVSTSTSSVSYNWTPSSGIASGATTANPTFTAAGSYSVIVTNTANGCASNASSNVVNVTLNNTIPTITISPSQTLTCTTPSIVVSTTVNPSTGISYAWTGNGVTGLTTNSVSVNQPGVYTTTVTNPTNGCTVTANVSIGSNTVAPTASMAVNSITTTCSAPNATLSVTATPTTGATYSWTAPGSGSLNTYTISNPVASGSGVFTVVVTNTINGCSNASSQATVEIIPDAAIPTVSVSANSLTITCTNTTVTTALTSTNTISSYSWSPAPVSGGANPVFNASGTYNATVTASNGCATNVSINVALDNTAPTITLSTSVNNGTLTCLTTSISVTPTVSPSSNLTFTWSPSTGISSPVNQSSVTFTAAGVYTLAVTNTVNGCVSTNTNAANSFTVIADNTPPTFTLGTAPSVTTTCAAPNATLSATSNAGTNAVYTWTTPTSSTLTGNPINTAAAGIYTVAVTNTVNGCSSSSVSTNTVEVVVDAGIPNINLSANSLSITCSNPTPSVSVSTTATPVSYSWSPTTGIVAGTETTANPSFNAAGSYSVVVTNTNSGCATDITTNVVTVILDNAEPVITLSSAVNDGTITCTNTSVVATPTVTPSGNLTYTWSPSAGISTPVNQSSATFTASGIYTLAVTNTLTGCVSTSTNSANTFTVYVNNATPTITATQTSTNNVIGCSNPIVSYSTNVTSTGSSLTYTWNPGGVNAPTIDISTAGVYDVTVMDAVSGCTASTQFTVDGNTTIPTADAGTNASIACGSSSVALTGSSTSTNVSYAWAGPSATSIISGSNTSSPTVADTGAYVLTITDNITGCQNTATVIVTQANVAATFTANPTSGVSPLTVNFTDQSTGANTWNWNFGDSNSSSSQNPTNTFNTGTYTVTLTASTGSCVSTATLLIVVEDGLTLEIPNVFTPNGDNANDIFTIKSSGVKDISLQIFNRWGEKLYEFAGAKASWDGITPNGGKAPEGTYFFFVKATGYDDKVIEQHGTLNLFR